MSHWLGCRLPGAQFGGADLQGAIWRHLELAAHQLDKANLRDSECVDLRMNGASWRPSAKVAISAPQPFLSSHAGTVRSVALGRAGDRDGAISGGSDGTVRIWDAVSGTEIAVLKGHEDWVRSVALGRAGDRDVAISGGDEGTVRIWDAVSGTEIAVLKGHENRVLSVAPGRAGDRTAIFIQSSSLIEVVYIRRKTFSAERTLILGPTPKTWLDLAFDEEGGCRLIRHSGDAWRYFRAQGLADGRLITMPIDDLQRTANGPSFAA
jgi:WD40 repeat protein